MKILFVPKEFPHGKVIGGPILVYNRIKHLARLGHEIGLASFIREADRVHLPTLEPYCREIELLPPPPPRSRWRRLQDFLFPGVPPYMCNTRSPQMSRLVGEMCRRGGYGVVLAEYAVMGQYLFRNPHLAPGAKRVISCHECYTRARRMQRGLSPFFSRAWWREACNLRGLARYEKAMYRSADLVLTLTAEERRGLIEYAPDLEEKIAVVPHGVDVEAFRPGDEALREKAIIFVGNYPHFPNADAVGWFHREGWPLLAAAQPDLKWFIVGRGPTPEIAALAASDPRITVTGQVDEVQPWLKRAAVFVCPVRLGKGFRGKVLEALACGLPVAATPLGLEGLAGGQDGEHFLAGAGAAGVARAARRLLGDAALRRRLGENGRRLVEERYSFRRGAELLAKSLSD